MLILCFIIFLFNYLHIHLPHPAFHPRQRQIEALLNICVSCEKPRKMLKFKMIQGELKAAVKCDRELKWG